MYPTWRTVLERTTEEYDISGSVVLQGRVTMSSATGQATDEPSLIFRSIEMLPQSPSLYLYLTTRSSWMRFDESDVFVGIPDGDPNFPDGSFSMQGNFRMTFDDTNVNVREYCRDGCYWYLWCDIFTVTLAGGRLLEEQEKEA